MRASDVDLDADTLLDAAAKRKLKTLKPSTAAIPFQQRLATGESHGNH